MCGWASRGIVYSAHKSYQLDWAPTSFSSFYRSYFLNFLSMSPSLFDSACGFIRTGCYFIMEGVYINHFNETFPNRCIGCGGVPDPLIYLLCIFILGAFKSLFVWRAHQFWNSFGVLNIHRCSYNPWNAQYFRTSLPIPSASFSCVHTYQWSQFRIPLVIFMYHTFYLLLFFVLNYAFYMHYILCCSLIVFESLFVVRVTFPSMLF